MPGEAERELVEGGAETDEVTVRFVPPRRSPALPRLPRRETNAVFFPGDVVKLRVSRHGGASRGGAVELFAQVTVPRELLSFYEGAGDKGECRFRVTVDPATGTLTYELVKGTWLGAPPEGADPPTPDDHAE
jgi:hypothetical protein